MVVDFKLMFYTKRQEMSNYFTFQNPLPNFSHKGTKTQRNTKGFYFLMMKGWEQVLP